VWAPKFSLPSGPNSYWLNTPDPIGSGAVPPLSPCARAALPLRAARPTSCLACSLPPSGAVVSSPRRTEPVASFHRAGTTSTDAMLRRTCCEDGRAASTRACSDGRNQSSSDSVRASKLQLCAGGNLPPRGEGDGGIPAAEAPPTAAARANPALRDATSSRRRGRRRSQPPHGLPPPVAATPHHELAAAARSTARALLPVPAICSRELEKTAGGEMDRRGFTAPRHG